MKQPGRKSVASRAIEPLFDHKPPSIPPPPTLSEPAREVFIALVSSCDPDHFQSADSSLLCQYSEAVALATRSAARLQEGDAAALGVWEKATRVMSGLALRLRLGPQSRRERAKAERPLPWSDRFRLEHSDGEPTPPRSRPWET
jgi:hypothetical protein